VNKVTHLDFYTSVKLKCLIRIENNIKYDPLSQSTAFISQEVAQSVMKTERTDSFVRPKKQERKIKFRILECQTFLPVTTLYS
jgi:hypothetical protein